MVGDRFGVMDVGSECVRNLVWLIKELGLQVNYKVGIFVIEWLDCDECFGMPHPRICIK